MKTKLWKGFTNESLQSYIDKVKFEQKYFVCVGWTRKVLKLWLTAFSSKIEQVFLFVWVSPFFIRQRGQREGEGVK